MGKVSKIFHEETNEFSLRERLIRKIVLFGFIFCIFSCGEILLATSAYYTLIPISVVTISLLVALILTYKYRKIEIAAALVGIVCIFIAFPSVFFLSGGIEGGATIWFSLGIFYAIGMYNGRAMRLMLGMAVTVYCVTYYIGYRYPQYIIPMDNKAQVYLDSLYGVILVGILLGVVTKYQLKAYDMERKQALEQKDEIAKFSNSKNDFFASMSHEIRTPINTIMGLVETILRQPDISDEVMENVTTIQSSGNMLLSLVNDILDISLIEEQKMEIVPVSYETKELFESIVDMAQVPVKEKELDFIVNIDSDIPAILYGDERRIKQILINILTNAVKYTKEGAVTLSARSEKIGEEWCKLIISVEDTGVGIKTERLETLFNSYMDLKYSDKQKGEGAGLGLSLSKKLVDLMGGELTVDSIYTRGSTFTVILEQQVIDKSSMGVVEFAIHKSKRNDFYQHLFEAPEARILVVDDNDMNRVVVSKLLKETKLQLDTVSSGKECLKKTKEKYYNVILMDYMMPEMDGLQTLKNIRKQENGLCKDSPVIVLTADQTLNLGKRFVEFGFDGMIEKPFRGIQLEQAILNFLPDDILEYRLDLNQKNKLLPGETILFSERNKAKVCITCDCVCDLKEEWVEKYNIKQIHLYINTDKSRFKDQQEVNSESISDLLIKGDNIWTEAATVEDYENFFASRLVESEDVIHISLGMNMGKSYENAFNASKGFGHVHVVDSGFISGGMALVVLAAGQMRMKGAGVSEIMNEIERVKKRICSSFMLPNINTFYSNGYTNKVVAKIYNLLQLHPVLKTKQSELQIVGFGIGKYDKTIVRFVKKQIKFRKPPLTDIIYITHAGLSVKQQEILQKEILKCVRFEKVVMQKCSVTNACFSGFGTVGIAFVVEK